MSSGLHQRGRGPAEGSIGNGVQGSGFRVQFRFLGRKQKQNKNKMKREMTTSANSISASWPKSNWPKSNILFRTPSWAPQGTHNCKVHRISLIELPNLLAQFELAQVERAPFCPLPPVDPHVFQIWPQPSPLPSPRPHTFFDRIVRPVCQFCILSQMSFVFFLSRMQFFVLSQQPITDFVPWRFSFVPWRFLSQHPPPPLPDPRRPPPPRRPHGDPPPPPRDLPPPKPPPKRPLPPPPETPPAPRRVMPAFGQTAFGQNCIWQKKIRIWPSLFRDRIWPNHTWPEPVFQSVDHIWPISVLECFGQILCCWCLLVLVGACWCLLVLVGACVCIVCLVGVFKIFGPLPRTPLRRTALPLDHTKFRSFFSLSHRKFHSFLSLWGSSR